MKNILKIAMLPMLVGVSMTSQAGFFDKLKDNVVNSAKSAANDTVSGAINGSGSGAAGSAGSVAGLSGAPSIAGGPAANLVAMTKCAGIKMTNIMTGYVDNYYFQQGMSREERSGFIKRQPGQITQGCILPSLNSTQAVYFEVDTKKYEGMGNSNDWTMQCVKSDDPSAGAITHKNEYAYKVNHVSPKDMMLHCGHSELNVSECASGSNSSRANEWGKKLKARGKTMLSVYANKAFYAPKTGDKLYCQYYNKKTGTSMFGIEYIRVKG